MSATPAWPAVIQHRDDDELVYLEHWDDEDELARWRYDEADRLIDSKGECFLLRFDRERGLSEPVATGERIGLEDFSLIIQRHLFALAQTCITKVVLTDYMDGFRTLAMLED